MFIYNLYMFIYLLYYNVYINLFFLLVDDSSYAVGVVDAADVEVAAPV